MFRDARSPYVQAKPFQWVQGDQVGGKSIMWGRGCYRMSDLDFTANLLDGHGVDWPIRYADIAPWYSYVERFVGISGERLGLPQLPDGEFQPPMEMNAGEKFVKDGIERSFRVTAPAGGIAYTRLSPGSGRLELLEGTGLRLKHRTGGIEAHLFPSPEQLAAVLAEAVAARIPFKLTAGLHEAVQVNSGQAHMGYHPSR